MIRRFLIAFIRLYQVGPGRIMPRVCRFEPTCSTFALQALAKHGLMAGLWMSIIRLMRCHPWHPGGYDPVPDRSRID